MKYDTADYIRQGETLHFHEYDNGLKAFVIPKKGFSRKYAAFATDFGSVDNNFIAPEESEITSVPDGIAHFLEHKLFEQREGSVMDDFSALGASPNAYTGLTSTVYLFSCTENFGKCFQMLLQFVQNPYFTEDSIKKERDIIGQEIRMKQDEPEWAAFFNLMRSLYPGNPVSRDISGSIESIGKIDKDILYKCHNTFYHPSNMIVIAIGDISPEEVFDITDRTIPVNLKRTAVRRIPGRSSGMSVRKYYEHFMAVSDMIFYIGFKDGKTGLDLLKREVTAKILLDLLIGRGSVLYDDLYSNGVVTSPVDFDYETGRGYAFSAISGQTTDPEKLREKVSAAIHKINAAGLDQDTFNRLKDSWFGRMMRTFNSIDSISHAFIASYFKGFSLFHNFDVYDKITLVYASDLFRELFDADMMSLSVVKPIGG